MKKKHIKKTWLGSTKLTSHSIILTETVPVKTDDFKSIISRLIYDMVVNLVQILIHRHYGLGLRSLVNISYVLQDYHLKGPFLQLFQVGIHSFDVSAGSVTSILKDSG